MAFEDFLRNFKSASSADTADALGSLNLNGNDTQSDYDFMDDAEEDAQATTNGQPKSKQKYMNLLQDIADRQITNLFIELDDLELVRRRASLCEADN